MYRTDPREKNVYTVKNTPFEACHKVELKYSYSDNGPYFEPRDNDINKVLRSCGMFAELRFADGKAQLTFVKAKRSSVLAGQFVSDGEFGTVTVTRNDAVGEVDFANATCSGAHLWVHMN